MSEAAAALARAQSLTEIRRWREALAALGPALAGESTAADGHCLAAQCHLGLGDPRAAAAAARRALAIDPQREWPHRLLGIAFLRSRQRRQAYAEAAEAARLAPGSAHALHLLTACQLALRQRAAAEQTALTAVAENPDEPLAHLTLARAATALRKYDLAERAYTEGLRLAPDNADLALGLAQLLHRRGRRDEAAQAYLAAGRANPSDSRARQGLARLGMPTVGVGIVGYAAARVFLLLGAGSGRPALAAVIAGVFFGLGCGITTLLRVRGTRRLPAEVRTGLRADHRNAALRWLAWAAAAAAVLAIWAAALPARQGGGLAEAAGFAVFAVAAGWAVHRLWTGPRPSLVELARGVGRSLTLRGRLR